MGGGRYILAGGGWLWVAMDIFWLVVDGGGWWWMVVGDGGWWWICFGWWWMVVGGGGWWWVVVGGDIV